MDIGFATAAGLWLVSGMLFWGLFVVLGFGFRPAEEDASAFGASANLRSRTSGTRAASAHVVARTRE